MMKPAPNAAVTTRYFQISGTNNESPASVIAPSATGM